MNVKELLSLRNKVILVTGGAGRYGQCIAEGLAEADGTVVIASRNQKAIEETAARFRDTGLDVHAMPVDQADPASVAALKAQIKTTFGRLDGFVNNAVSRPMKGYDAPIDQFAESMTVNATGMMDILREMADLIEQSGGGSIINIGSIFGMYGPDLSNYEGTNMGTPPPDYFFHNGGLINLNRYMAKVLAGKNIRVNCISPGGLFSHQPQQFLDNYTKKVPLRRMANQDDIKGLVVLLASEAGAYINGENIVMDGGMKA
ncbi:SDR family oxidoreductase [Larkinella knui]|uniref:SDR family oxidoreductase n=1 Tax=Larkinella knui TaxID=2025310 RepID=A0A3P1CNU0_9BACT|nr:SDR family oxidoreductase [Larkinella knui]RRB14888.1 SDR family oxidoreductase [Larkinella knui]